MRKILISTITGLVLAGLVACSVPTAETQSPQATVLPAVQAGSTVIAEGKVVPASSVSLSFETSGTVAEILIKEGDTVEAGAPLARLDTRDLSLRVEQAQVSLEQAQADYDRLLEGATPEQIAAVEAEIARARGQLQATAGSVTPADIAAARAELESARARLAELQAGPRAPDVASAQAAVDQARIGLQQQRDALAQARITAELNLEQAANALRNAQDEYSRVYWQNREREKQPGELPQEFRDREAAAQRAVENGETALAQARLTLEQARQAEITGIQAAEAAVRDAEARYARLVSPAEADAIAAARSQIAAAEARLARLSGAERAGNVAAAEAGVRNAEARLAELQADPTDATLSAAAARVRGAEVALKQARLALERATLDAPIAGTVAELNLKIGEVAGPTAPAVVLADLRNWQIETEDLTELSVVQIREGDPVRITFDALPGFELPGAVAQIKPLGRNRQGDIVYTVVVKPGSWDERLRWNMTASVAIGG
ncbi:MAG: biotin/lipoyl-binding protein [Chloroflexaceae bacterium]